MMRRPWNQCAILIALAVLVVVPWFLDDYTISVFNTAGTYAIVAVGLSLFCGRLRQYPLGHAGFFAIGAFTAALLATRLDWPIWLDLPAAGLAETLAGVALGLPTLRLGGPYLAIATLGFGLLVQDILNKADWAGGRTGVSLTPIWPDRGFYWLILALLVAGAFVVHNLRHGSFGRALLAARENEAAAQASGIDVARYRVAAFAVSTAFAGVAGALFAHWSGFVSSSSFGLPLSITFVAMVVVGGVDHTPGVIVGAGFLTALQQVLEQQPHLADALYAAIIIAVLLLGQTALARRLLALFRRIPPFAVGQSHG